MTVGKALFHGSMALVLGLGLTLAVFGQDPTAATSAPARDELGRAVHEHTLIDPQILDFIKVFGFGGMIFIVWWWDARKIDKLTKLIERYQHLAESFEQLARDGRDTAIMCANVTTKVTEKLDALMRQHEAVSRSSGGPA